LVRNQCLVKWCFNKQPSRFPIACPGNLRYFNNMFRTHFPWAIFLFAALTAGQNGHSVRDVYSQIRIPNATPYQIHQLADLGLAVDDGWVDRTGSLHLPVSANELKKLDTGGWAYTIDIDDMTAYYKARSVPAAQREFPLGSLLGNYTLEEELARIDTLHLLYPNLVSAKDSIGTTIEGRTIWAFKISDNPAQDEDEPEVLFTGLTHAREPVGMMNLLYFAQQLCENYNTDPELTFLVNNREIWFIPMVNVDGYVWNQENSVGGGGMQRKNRRDTGCGTSTGRGVDLNRNFDYDWGGPGASSYACDETFRGDSAFSEPESRTVRDFILYHNFSNVLHYHTYGNDLIIPFGDGSYPPEPDLTTFREIGKAMTVVNHFQVGTGTELLSYGVSGDQADWTYGAVGLISYIPEVGTTWDGFWPSEDRILPLCQDQLLANEVFAHVAGPALRVKPFDARFSVLASDSLVHVQIQNWGLQPSGTVHISYSALNSVLDMDPGMQTLSSVDARSLDTLSIPIQLAAGTLAGMETGLIFRIDGPGLFTTSDTLRWIIGTPEILVSDDFESGTGLWNLGNGSWGVTDDAFDGQFGFTDSPTGNYSSHAQNIVQLTDPVDLTGLTHPTIQFVAHWDIEARYDFVQVQALVPNHPIVNLRGTLTTLGSGLGTQPSNQPGYDGHQSTWVWDVLDLSPVANQSNVTIQFVLSSDGYQQANGFVLDDFSVRGFPFYIAGDINPDQDINILDLLTLSDWSGYSSVLSPLQLFLADINQDSVVDDQDFTLLLQQIME